MSFLTTLFGTTCKAPAASQDEKKDDLPIEFTNKPATPIESGKQPPPQPVSKPDSSFLCPISLVLMTDPVMAMDGHTYERSAITKWLENNNTSPQSNITLPAKTLIPNHNLKSQIAAWKTKHEKAQVPGPASSPVTSYVLPLEAIDSDEKTDDGMKNVGGLELNVLSDSEGLVRFSVSAGEVKESDCPPVDLVLVMDRSGSMGTAVVGVDADTQMVMENGFSTLDLVKHAMRTCVNALRPVDRLALILFDNQINVAFALTAMDANGINMALQKIDSVRERGSTNIYGAVQEAVRLIESRNDKSRNPAILFFTDGVPNVSPASGELAFFNKMMKQKKLSFPIHTFGFGSWAAINSSLLYDMAKIFNGMFGYIPDATFVGTTFVNAITNILTTAAINVQVHVKMGSSQGEGKLHVGDLNYNMEREDDVVVVNVGTVRYGQSFDFLIEFPSKVEKLPYYYLTYNRGDQVFRSNNETMVCVAPSAQDHLLRFQTIEMLKKVIRLYRSDLNASAKLVSEHIASCDGMKLLDDTSMGIIEQLKGQNTKMLLKRKYMDKWGKHQTRQYIRSLNLQIKNNFKDPGVQHFGGRLFEDLADKIDDIFNNMDPPKPSLATKATKVVASPRSFAKAYNNVRNDYINGHGNTNCGCFAGDGEVLMGDGSKKLVCDVCPGDLVATPEGARQVVLVRRDEVYHQGCLVKGLWITPKHPMRVDGKWLCPYMTQEVDSCCPVTTWYNFELKLGNSFIINGLELVALGHNNVISLEDPAFCPEKDALYGQGWSSNPERQMYLGKTCPETEMCNSSRRMTAF